jgi:tetratricopeptide (TPR) repeat protein
MQDQLRQALGDRYDVVRELGRGGMAIVYLARDLRHDRLVAIKVMRPEITAASGPERFLREIKLAARLQHPHILPVHDSGAAGDHLYYVMPFVQGESLRDRLTRGPLSVAMAVEIAREVADALDHAHAQGVVHRDIKPENILLTSTTAGHAMVADFGVALAIGHAVDDARATATGIAVGSPAYMSPEQAMGDRDVDARADIYSLGCMLYEMLTGEPPYGRASARAAMAGHVSGSPAPLGRGDIPIAVQAAVDRAMAKPREERFASARAFADALRLDGATVSLGATRERRAVRPGLRLAAMAAAVLVLVAAGTLVSVRSGSPAALGGRATVVIADVENATGDPVFRNSLGSALAAGIGQSDHVTLATRSRIRETLARMQRVGADSLLDERLAREVAVREGFGAVILPSVAVFDSTYVITARVLDPATGAELATETARSQGKGAVIDAIDDLSRALRRDFGESMLSVLRRSNPLPQVTTRSLDALEKFAAGNLAWDNGRMAEARELWRGALAIDSGFALAHVNMGRFLSWVNNIPEADKHFERALANMDRITDRERMWAAAQIAWAHADWEQAATHYRAYLSRYPNYAPAWANLGTTLMRDNRPRDALAAFDRFMALDSTSGSSYINIATSYSRLSLYDSAVVFYRKSFALRPDYETWENVNHEYGTTLIKAGRLDEARATYHKMLARPRAADRARAHRSLALLDLLYGQPRVAVPRLVEAISINASMKERTSEARNWVFLASTHQIAGNRAGARAAAEKAYQLFEGGYLEPVMAARVAAALLESGARDRAAHVLDSVRARTAAGNNYARAHLLALQARIAHDRHATDSALSLIQQAAALDSSAEVIAPMATIRAAAGDVSGAISDMRRLRENESNVGYEPQFEWTLSRYRLGQLYEKQGDLGRARIEYEAFLSEWKDADPSLPAIVDTRARLKRMLTLTPKRDG